MQAPAEKGDSARGLPRSWRLVCIFTMGTLAGFAVPLWVRQAFGQDWKYFDSLSLVVRSIVVHYHRFPLQDPWVLGGMDIPANPQSRVFAPTSLFDILVPPPYANLASVLACTFVGAWGAYLLLRGQRIPWLIAAAGALLFVNSTFFGLHFGEGHVLFEMFLLLPWVLHLAIHAHRPSAFLWLLFLLALFLLDGAMYPFIHALVLLLACALVGIVHPIRAGRGLLRSWQLALVGVVASALLALAKVVPVSVLYGKREPELDLTVVSTGDFARMLFDPRVTLADTLTGSRWRFHEFGCYVGVLAVLVIVSALFVRGFAWKHRAWFALMGLWLWIATGWGYPYNPWWLFQRLPLINNAHVQSRFLLLFHIAFVVVLCHAVAELARRWTYWSLVPWLLVLEALAAKNYALHMAYASYPAPQYTTTLITSPGIRDTLPGASKPWNYFDGTHSSKDTYEPAHLATHVRAISDADYRGEVYTTSGRARVTMQAYTPGRIEVQCAASEPSTFVVNANFLAGWVVQEGQGVARASTEDLIAVAIPAGTQTLVLAYRPTYLMPVVVAYGCGVGLFAWLAACRLRNPRRKEAPV